MKTKNNKTQSEVIEAAGGLLWRSKDGGKEIAIIHRDRYDDWTLPKGKRETGETWTETALREVFEETGCRAELNAFAGGIIYTVNECPKIVLYWHMKLVEDLGLTPNDEVDQLIWLAPHEAAKIMSYPAEVSLLP